MDARELTIALAGNPNSGKTTLFNALTGAHQKVGNYPGVTVEKKEGSCVRDGRRCHVIDLPGTYSLTAYSIEEIVARNVIMEDRPDVVVDIVDSSNLERNLYLATQLLELGVPLVLAFNMADLAKSRGYSIDNRLLSSLLGVPIVDTVARKGQGTDELLQAARRAADDPAAALAAQRVPNYGHEVEPHVKELADRIAARRPDLPHRRWFALKLLEGDNETHRRLERICPEHLEEFRELAARLRQHIESVCGDSVEILLADRRYGFISGACTEAVRRSVETRHEWSDKIDAVVTNRYLGLPIFAVLMFLVFQITFSLGNPMVEVLDGWKNHLAGTAGSLLATWLGEGSLIKSLLVNGVIEGVGAVLSFVPLVVLLFLCIAVLEDTGYMARAAFVMDRLMHRIGLHGKSFIPMLVGFGCSVPAIMATRVLGSRRDRLATMLVVPLMSCGARLPIYLLILGAFFPPQVVFGLLHHTVIENGQVHTSYYLSITNQALILFGIYVLGILLAIGAVKVLRSTILRGEVEPFVMELPPYRMPTGRGLLIHVWERAWMYIKKAGTVILAILLVMWVLNTFPRLSRQQVQQFEQRSAQVRQDLDAGRLTAEQADGQLAQVEHEQGQAALAHSITGRLGKAMAPAIRPLGFDWKIGTALLGAFAAKEVFVGQMGVIYAVGDEADEQSDSLRERIAAEYTPLQGLSIMIFCLICSPCMATVAITARESGHWKWAAFVWIYLTALAYVVTLIVYQGALALGLG